MSEAEHAGRANGSPNAARDISKAAGQIGLLVLLSRVLGFLRDAIIAAKFGQNEITSAYLYAFTLPDTLWNLVAGGAFFAAFVPVITEYYTQGKDRDAQRTYDTVTTLVAIVLTIAIVPAWIFARVILEHFLAPGFTNYAVVGGHVVHPLDMAVHMTRIVLPCQYFFFLGTLMMGMLQARKQFLFPAWAPVIYNAGIIVVGLALSRWLGISAFSWGAVLGASVGSFFLQWVAVRRIGVRFQPCLDLSHPGVRQAGRLVLPVLLGVGLPQASQIVNGMFVAHFGAAKTILEFSNRLMSLPLGIFGQAIGIVALPTLKEQATQGDMTAFRRTLNYGIRLALFLTVPTSVLMILLAKPILTIVYQRGAFTAADTMAAIPAFVFFALGVGAWSAQAVVARAFYARNDTWTPMLAGTFVTFCVFIPLNVMLSRLLDVPNTPLITRGPAIATTAAATLNTLLLIYFAAKRFGGMNVRRLLRSVIRMTIACVPMGVATWAIYAMMELLWGRAGVAEQQAHGLAALLDRPHLLAFGELLLAGGLGLALFIGAAVFVRSPELKDLQPMVGGMVRKLGPLGRVLKRFGVG